MKGVYAISLLIVSNIFMTFAWYGHLKLQETKMISNWPLYGVVLFSWVIALAEYSCQVPANRLGFSGNGGPFSLMQLKIIQEVITLIIFTVFSTLLESCGCFCLFDSGCIFRVYEVGSLRRYLPKEYLRRKDIHISPGIFFLFIKILFHVFCEIAFQLPFFITVDKISTYVWV